MSIIKKEVGSSEHKIIGKLERVKAKVAKVELEYPEFTKAIKQIRAEIEDQDQFFINTVKELNEEVKKGFEHLDAIRVKIVREKADLQLDLQQMKNYFRKMKDMNVVL